MIQEWEEELGYWNKGLEEQEEVGEDWGTIFCGKNAIFAVGERRLNCCCCYRKVKVGDRIVFLGVVWVETDWSRKSIVARCECQPDTNESQLEV